MTTKTMAPAMILDRQGPAYAEHGWVIMECLDRLVTHATMVEDLESRAAQARVVVKMNQAVATAAVATATLFPGIRRWPSSCENGWSAT